MDVLVSKVRKRAAWITLAVLVSLATTSRANAQDAETPAEGDPVAQTDAPATEPAPLEPAPVTEPVTEPASEPAAVGDEAAPAEAAAEEAAEDTSSWTDNLSFRVFADAYVAAHWTLPDGFEGNHTAADQIGHRAYDVFGGLALSFAGLDLRYAPDPIGAAIDIRFGSSVPRLLGPFANIPEGLQFLKQAFVSWRPIEAVQIDFGQFDTPYGAEVSESWLNPNYSRGSLYNVIQPFYHTGFRASWAVIPELTLTAILVNGWNNNLVYDNNDGKSGGIQASLALGDFSMALGYLTGPEQTGNDDNFRHLVDVIFRLNVGDLALVANGDLVYEDDGVGPDDDNLQVGAMIGAQYTFIPELAIALRGEVLYFPDIDTDTPGVEDNTLSTGTLTIDVRPVSNLVIRLDNRLDVASNDRFINNEGQPTETVFSTILGVVVHSD